MRTVASIDELGGHETSIRAALIGEPNSALTGNQLMEAGATVSQMLHAYFAPGALGMAHQDVARFLHFKRAAQTMGGNLLRTGVNRRGLPGSVFFRFVAAGCTPVPGASIGSPGQRAGELGDC